ncbi:MAG: hypothetical protein ACFE0Q_19650 [Anaerolineae bacterium]
MRLKKIVTLLGLILILSFSVITSQAQQTLAYGSGTVGTLAATTPVVIYTFQGNAGDSVTIQVFGLTPDLQPAISLNAITGQQLATSSNDNTNIASNSARINHRLNQTGIHTIIVTALNAGTGDYAIRLDGIATTQETQVDETGNSTGTVSAGNNLLIYSIAANPDTAQVATITTNDEGVVFSVSVFSLSGQQIGLLSGSSEQASITTLPAGTGTYTLEVTVNAQADGSVNVSVTPIGDSSAQEPPTLEPESSGEVTQTAEPQQEVEPTLEPESSGEATQTATTQQQVTSTVEPESPDDATQTAPTQQQQVQATATFTPSYTPTQQQQVQATATFTPSYTPTQPATATPTPSYTPTTPPVQVAPPDSRFNNPLTIELDSTVSVLNFVSYPDGDTEDRVRYDVTGMNNNSALSGGRARLVISVSCFGQNTDQIQFFTGGQTYSCGQTIVDREVTADSDTGSIVITAIGGEGTYVQWVLTGTATRIN